MSQFNLSSGEAQPPVQKQKKVISKKMKIALGAAVLLLIPILGTTFAASIAVNGGSAVQFGQGVASVNACDTAVTIGPAGDYNYASDAFHLETVTISNLDTIACAGKTITLRAYDSSTSTSMVISNGTDTKAIKVSFSGASGAATVSGLNGTPDYTATFATGSTGSLTISLPTNKYATSSAAISSSLTRFTFETS
jgi:hypothetical protein